VIGRWWSALGRRRDERVLRQRAIPDDLWSLTLARFPFLQRRPAPDLERLRRLATLFLDRKEFTGANGLEVSDEIAVAIAAQACLPVLELGLEAYDGFVGIVVHPDEVVARREVTDDDGVVHTYDEPLTGEAMPGGPVMLSWRDVLAAQESDAMAYNVVIHEFAHVLDMRDGEADGCPPLPGGAAARRAWAERLEAVLDDLHDRIEHDLDTGVLDPYAAEGPEELFAVASEAFFVDPLALRSEHADLYRLLAGFYRQDPAAAG
jgi:Mlc titration factor MtfA (ptsG expression regulator)